MSPPRRTLPFAILVIGLAAGVVAWIGFAPAPPAPPGSEQVILLHGLGRSRAAMWYMERRLDDEGYRADSVGYPSTDEEFDDIVALVAKKIAARDIGSAPRVHFVTHSLGGLVARAYIAKHRPPNLGRVVMLAPPSRGSPVIDGLREAGVSVVPIGPTGRALGGGQKDLPARLPPPDYPVGVVAGSADLLVPAERARLEGMTDFIVLDTGHTWMLYNSDAADQVVHFLREGRFDH